MPYACRSFAVVIAPPDDEDVPTVAETVLIVTGKLLVCVVDAVEEE